MCLFSGKKGGVRGPRKRRKLLESLSEGIHLSALAVTSLREDIQYHNKFHHLFGFNVSKVVYTIETKDLPWHIVKGFMISLLRRR